MLVILGTSPNRSMLMRQLILVTTVTVCSVNGKVNKPLIVSQYVRGVAGSNPERSSTFFLTKTPSSVAIGHCNSN